MERSDGMAAAVTAPIPAETDWLIGLYARVSRTAAYDIAVKAVFALWYLYLAHHVVGALMQHMSRSQFAAAPAQSVSSILALASILTFYGTFAVFAMLRPRPVARAKGLLPRVNALVGTCLMMALPFFPRRDLSIEMNVLTAVIALTGEFLAVYVVCRLGKSLSIMPEARRLVTSGPYRLIRHPLYVAEELAIIGTFLQYASIWTFLLGCAHWVLQMGRMRNEERILSATFPEYAAYARRTARLIPGLY